MRRRHLAAATLLLIVISGLTVLGAHAPKTGPFDTHPVTGWGSPVERACRLVPLVHRYFYPVPVPIFLCPSDPGQSSSPP